MAAALLIGTNAWAGTYNVGSESDFQNAWAKAYGPQAEDVVINLTSSGITLSKTMWLGTANLGDAAHTVEINLNGNPLVSTASGNAFILTHGTLKFSGNGQFTAENATNVFYVTGSTNKDVDPSAENANYFSHLEIGEGVIIAHGAYGTGIAVDGVWKGSTAQAASTAFIPASKPALTYITNVYANAKATLDKRDMQYLYKDGNDYVMMDLETYEQLSVPEIQVGDGKKYLKENMNVSILLHDAKIIGVDIPNHVELAVIDTPPSERGNTAQGSSKPATLETGAVVQVPFFVAVGDVIRVDTRTNEYLDRV